MFRLLLVLCLAAACSKSGGGSGQDAGGECPPGQVSCACRDDGTCDPSLECVEGICQQPGCPAGTLGCPCGAGGACSDSGATCNADGLCEQADCPLGTAGCPCSGGSGCDGGLECVDGVCRSAGGPSLTVDHPEVRSCDVLVLEQGAHVIGVTFAESVIGEHIRRAPRNALSFVAKTDAPLSGSVAQFEFDAGSGARSASVIKTECFDGLGRPVDGATVQLQ